MKKAFSLIELIVVIAIIGTLAGVLLASFGGGTASARSARCLSNMKNLANAAQTYAMQSAYYPCAGNVIYMQMVEKGNGRRPEKTFKETPGWVSADSKDMFPSGSYSKPETVSMYSDDDEAARYALTNGVLWKYVSGSRETYVCPEHARHAGKGAGAGSAKVGWSYLMNAYFSWDKAGKPRASVHSGRRSYGQTPKAEKRLLFCEVPFMGYNTWQPSGTSASTDTDAILQFGEGGLDEKDDDAKLYSGGGSSSEEIGVNHKNGRSCFAHVAFADGHVEKLRVPMKGTVPDTTDFDKLTTWLCAGYDVSFDGKKYRRVE